MCPTSRPRQKRKTSRRRFREIRSGGAAAAGCKDREPRAARLPNFVGLAGGAGAAGTTLDRLRAMVVGTGSVGGEVVQHLARLQIKEIWTVDPGRLKPASVLTHGIPPAAAGKQKARYWGRQCKAISPATRVRYFAGPVQSLPLGAVGRVDLVVMATDNLAAEIEVGERCLRQRVPLVQASVHGDTLVAQARYWGNRTGSGACPCCAYADSEWSMVSRQTAFRCGGPDGHPVREADVAATMSVSPLCALASDMAMMQVLRHVLHLGPPLEDSVTEYCGFTQRTMVSPLVRNPDCRADHVVWRTVPVAGRLAARSLRQLALAALGEDPPPADLAFTVGDDLLFVERVDCCGWPQTIRRFCAEGAPVAGCPRCGAALEPQSFYSHRPVSAATLGALVDRPLRRLGAASAREVVVHYDGQAVLCQEEEEEDQEIEP